MFTSTITVIHMNYFPETSVNRYILPKLPFRENKSLIKSVKHSYADGIPGDAFFRHFRNTKSDKEQEEIVLVTYYSVP